MGGKYKAMTLISEAELARMRDRQLTEYNPSVRAMTKLQSLIDKVFDEKALSPDEKQKILNTLRERFSQLYSKYKNSASSTPTPAVIPPSPPPPPNPTAPPSHADSTESIAEDSERGEESYQEAEETDEDAVDTTTDSDSSFVFPSIDLAERYSRKVGLFKEFLKANKNVLGSTPRNELVLDGKVFPNTSFSDLVRNMYIRGTRLNLTGSSEFMDKLAGLKADPTMFSNSDNILILTSLLDYNKRPTVLRKSQSGKGQKRKLSLSHFSAPPGKLPRILHLFRI